MSQSPPRGVADILAAYGVEPAKKGARPEVEDEEPEDRRPRGSSGEGGTRMRRWRGEKSNRQELIDKYPALQGREQTGGEQMPGPRMGRGR